MIGAQTFTFFYSWDKGYLSWIKKIKGITRARLRKVKKSPRGGLICPLFGPGQRAPAQNGIGMMAFLISFVFQS